MKIPSGTTFQDNILVLNSEENIDKRLKMSFAGWGLIHQNEYEKIKPKVLQKTKIKLIGEKECRKILLENYNKRLGNKVHTVLCANTSDGGIHIWHIAYGIYLAYAYTFEGFVCQNKGAF